MRAVPFILACAAAVAPAAAAPITSSALLVPAGPSAEDAAIGPVWISACAKGDSLVGARMLQAGGISGVVAICAPLNSSPEGLAWGAEPQAVKGPPVPPPPVMVTRNVSHQLRGRIQRAAYDGTYEERNVVYAELVLEETIPDPSVPPSPPVVQFAHKSASDVMCPSGSFVKGIRYQAPAAGGIEKLELQCAQSAGRVTVVAMTEAKSAAATGRDIAHLQRIDCKGMASNPDDGEAANAIFGTVDETGRVQSVGLSCAPAADPSKRANRFGVAMAN